MIAAGASLAAMVCVAAAGSMELASASASGMELASASSTGGLELAAAAAAANERVFLLLFVNTVRQRSILVHLRGKDVLVNVQDLKNAGMHDFAGKREKLEGVPYVSLASLAPAVSFELDERAVALQVKVSPALLGEVSFDLHGSARPSGLVVRDDSSAFLNYSLQLTDFQKLAAFGEAGISVSRALLYSNFSRYSDGRFLRGMSNLTIDEPSNLRRWILGDTVAGAAGGQSTGVLLAGLTVAREFSLDPYFIRTPLPRLSGAATGPSTLDVYVNGALVRSEAIDPGTFELKNLPVTEGAGTVRYVVRDAFGRSQEIASPYYYVSSILQPGLSEYSYSAGFRRADVGVNFLYDRTPIFIGRHRLGLKDWLTGGLRLEGGTKFVSGGPAATVRLPLGAFELSAAASGEAGSAGAAASAAYTMYARGFAISGSASWQSRFYSTATLRPAADRELLRAAISVGFPIAGPFSLSGGYARAMMRDTGLLEQASAVAGVNLGRGASLNLTASVSREQGAQQASAFATFVYVFGERTVGDASIQRDNKGASLASAHLQRSLPLGDGLGYRLQAQGSQALPGQTPQTLGSGTLQAQSPYGYYEAGYQRAGQTGSTQLTMAGGIAAIGGGLYATRPLQQGFALIQVPGVEGVRGYFENQEVGRTNSSGNLLVPNMLPYYGDGLSIADRDVPFGYDIGKLRELVAVPNHGGAVVRFDVARGESVTGTLRAGSKPAAFGEVSVNVAGRERSSPISETGQFYLEGIPAGLHHATLHFGGESCGIDLRVGTTKETLQDLGALSCTPHGDATAAGGALLGTLFLDRNGNGRRDPDEPAFDGFLLSSGGKEARTDAEGRFALRGLPPGRAAIAVRDLPAGYNLVETEVDVAGDTAHDLALRFPKPVKDTGSALVLDLPSGPLRLFQIQAATFPLATWVEGEALSRAEDAAIQRLGSDVLDAPDLRVLVVVTLPSGGQAPAFRQALVGARAVQRYLKGPALVPQNRLLWTLTEAPSGTKEAGHIDVLLVRTPTARADNETRGRPGA